MEQTEETDAVLSLNESFFSLRRVLCAAEVFVVPKAFDKASLSSQKKKNLDPHCRVLRWE